MKVVKEDFFQESMDSDGWWCLLLAIDHIWRTFEKGDWQLWLS